MAAPRNTRPRSRDRQKRKPARKPAAPREEKPRSVYIAPYGDVPLIPVTWSTPEGRPRTYYTFDPSYEPLLPPGAVRADITRQIGSALGLPRYYYIDRQKRC